MLRSVPELRLHYLPAVANRRMVGAFDFNRLVLAINAVARKVGLESFDLPLYRKGQVMSFNDINRLMSPIERLRGPLELPCKWEHHPTNGGEMYTAAHMNELYAKVNEAIDEAFERDDRTS
jgi:hypothetical protein